MFFGACTKEHSSFYKHQKQTSHPVLKTPKNLLTKHFDIPIPCSFSLQKASSSRIESTIRDYQYYVSNLSTKETYAFFRNELEKNDWEINDISLPDQMFLYCTKPHKQCGIQINKNSDKNTKATMLSIFISQDDKRVHNSF